MLIKITLVVHGGTCYGLEELRLLLRPYVCKWGNIQALLPQTPTVLLFHEVLLSLSSHMSPWVVVLGWTALGLTSTLKLNQFLDNSNYIKPSRSAKIRIFLGNFRLDSCISWQKSNNQSVPLNLQLRRQKCLILCLKGRVI